MRAGSLRCFKVYVPNEQGGDALMCWQTPSPYAPLPFIGTWGDSQIGTGVKNMAKDFFKGVKGGFPRAVKNKPLRIPTWCQERGQTSSQELSTRNIC